MTTSAADPPKRDKDEIMTPSMPVEFHTPEPSPSPVSQCSEITIPSPGPDPAALDLPSKECRRTQAIYLPDLFASVMGMGNRVNPHYESVKERSQAFVQRVLRLSEEAANKLWAADFAYLTSTWVPDATEERLYVLQLWQLWAFIFDDNFDEGVFSCDPLGAAIEVINCLAVLDHNHPVLKEEEASLAFLFQHLWLEFCKTATEDHKRRFKLTHRTFMIGLLRQVSASHKGDKDPRSNNYDAYFAYRRDTIGVEPSYAIVEWASGLNIPQEAFDHPSVAACRMAGVEITFFDNDILSLQKDLDYDFTHNSVSIIAASEGCTVQQAVDRISAMLDERYATILAAFADPQLSQNQWGEGVDEQIKTMLELYIRLAVGSLHWSFRSGRYFGDRGEEVRMKRLMYVTPKSRAV